MYLDNLVRPIGHLAEARETFSRGCTTNNRVSPITFVVVTIDKERT